MVTMNSEKAAAKRKPEANNGGCTGVTSNEETIPIAQPSTSEESPNHLLYKKMEKIVEKMQDETTGVPVRTVKSFMSKIPSVFTGSDLIMWMMKNLDVEDQQEALHLAHLMAAHGYFFPIDDHMLTVKNDSTFYRFQTPYFWPSNCWEPENTDYAVYLCKRTMQNKTRLELADYEAENLARLQKMFSRKWEFIFMQAEAQSKVDKKRDKLERKVLDSQERAFWDVHRPMPGCVNTTEIDIKKACQMNKPIHGVKNMHVGPPRMSPSTSGNISKVTTVEAVKKQISLLKSRLERRNIKVSKAAESFVAYYEQYLEYDCFFVAPEYPNPWIADNPELWEQEKQAKDISARRVKRWAFSLQELLQDPVGRDHFVRFLDREFSGENLKFWEAVQELKALPHSQVQNKVAEIWAEFLASDASCPINVDARSYEVTKKNMEVPDRWSFDCAAAHVYHLMKSDSYSRYLRSEMYKEFLNGSKKKTSVKGIRSIVSFSARKDNIT
ncbi:regulator of G-protein signaling 7 [Aethina tumida]|uniref:regulator of G-protein signaling 7 n=1 Tax=Aethina tumida TaxID=116153 RepID=UPI00096AE50F|nr:regulator of G-protein signaling 7 [Aethina tumida]XP_019869456.1 regulator of G-protein signaling 7 [Aethina tumida]